MTSFLLLLSPVSGIPQRPGSLSEGVWSIRHSKQSKFNHAVFCPAFLALRYGWMVYKEARSSFRVILVFQREVLPHVVVRRHHRSEA